MAGSERTASATQVLCWQPISYSCSTPETRDARGERSGRNPSRYPSAVLRSVSRPDPNRKYCCGRGPGGGRSAVCRIERARATVRPRRPHALGIDLNWLIRSEFRSFLGLRSWCRETCYDRQTGRLQYFKDLKGRSVQQNQEYIVEVAVALNRRYTATIRIAFENSAALNLIALDAACVCAFRIVVRCSRFCMAKAKQLGRGEWLCNLAGHTERLSGERVVLDRQGPSSPRDIPQSFSPVHHAHRPNFWNLIRLGIRLSAPRRRFLSSS